MFGSACCDDPNDLLRSRVSMQAGKPKCSQGEFGLIFFLKGFQENQVCECERNFKKYQSTVFPRK